MGRFQSPARLGRALALALAMSALVPAASAWVTPKQVLVLYSTRRDAQVAIRGDRDLPRILTSGLNEGVDLYSEYLDLGRIAEPGYQDAFSDFLRLKYKGQRFDLLIAIQDVAIDFVSHRRDDLFPRTPLVFVATPGASVRIANSTGLSIPPRLPDTIGLAVALQPDLRTIFVVTGADARDRVYEQTARAQLGTTTLGREIVYLAGLTTADLEARVSALPPNSAIYYVIVNRDGAGASFHPLNYLERLAAVANAPIYSWIDSAMQHGIVGGSLKDLDLQTEAVGNLALRVLRGESADSIPVSAPNLNINEVDWRELRRWGISESRVPPGTRLLFKVPSIWDRYRYYIAGAVAIVLAQTALIVGLLVQLRRRRQAEEDVARERSAVRASYDRIRDLGARLLTAQDEERSRIARELHDDISQQIALLTIDLQLLQADREGGPQRAGEALNRAQELVKSIHDLSHRLHPAKLQLMGLVAAIEGLRREMSRSEFAIIFTHDELPALLPLDLTVTLFRITQEALQNAHKYSQANGVVVHLRNTGDALTLAISDNGVGFDVDGAWKKGLGLVSIGERLEAIGGRLEVQSSPGAGTRLVAHVPLRSVEAV